MNLAERTAVLLDCVAISNHPDQDGILKYLSDFIQIDQKFQRDCLGSKNSDEFIEKVRHYQKMIEPICVFSFKEKVDNVLLYSFSRYSILNKDMQKLHFEIELYLNCVQYSPSVYNADNFGSIRS